METKCGLQVVVLQTGKLLSSFGKKSKKSFIFFLVVEQIS